MSVNKIEPEEILLDSSSIISKIETPIDYRRVLFLNFLFFGLMIFLFIAVFNIQIIKGDYYRLKADLNAARFFKIPAPRGIIYDKNKTPLVFNKPEFDLIMETDFLKNISQQNKDYILKELNKILKIKELNFDYLKSDEEIILYEDIPQNQVLNLLNSDLFANFKGFKIVNSIKRYYPFREVFSHILGYIGKINAEEYKINYKKGYSFNDYIGKSGIELFYENQLRGVDGYKKYEINAFGKISRELTVNPPQNGNDIILSIDSKLQKKIYDSLKDYIHFSENGAAAVIAIDPRDGKILAMVSLPDFDNNIFTFNKDKTESLKLINSSAKPLFNRAISGMYPSGSIIKPFIAIAALEEKIIDPNKKIFAAGSISIPNIYNPGIVYTFHDWKEHGWINMREAISVSSDVYFYTIGGGYQDIKGLGADKIKKYLDLFGFGKETGIDMFGEAAGLIPYPQWKKSLKGEDWYIGDTYNLSIGQGDFLATPLQIAVATAVIANGGKLFTPELLENEKPKIVRQDFINPENLKVVREGMRMVVTKGTAKSLNSVPVAVAAKTGTAQNSFGAYHAWITTFAPYDNPDIVLTVLIERAGEGSSVAAPVAREVLNWYFSQK